LRTASRILVRFGEFYAAAFSELRKKAARLPWDRFLTPGQPVSIRVTCHKSKLYHSDAVAERIAGAISDCLKVMPEMDHIRTEESGSVASLIVVRLNRDLCTISVDSSGELLHRRGYRLETAKAPLRETLAAGMILASGWDRVSPVLDPFCGSGTIPIEAALLARNVLPGKNRHFSFMNWPGYDKNKWDQLSSAKVIPLSPAEPQIFGSDRDSGAKQISQSNAVRAELDSKINFSCCAISAIDPPAQAGWVITNPPYGIRVSAEKDLRNLYAQFGNTLRLKCKDWHFAILSSDLVLLHSTKLDFEQPLSLVNGGVRVHLAIGIV
jgi:putative N6-adenine-specific DNA methylase